MTSHADFVPSTRLRRLSAVCCPGEAAERDAAAGGDAAADGRGKPERTGRQRVAKDGWGITAITL